MNSQMRRRARRAQKQATWNAVNSLVLSLCHSPDAPPDVTALAGYQAQMEDAVQRAELARRGPKDPSRRPPNNPMHITTAREKRRGKSIPLI